MRFTLRKAAQLTVFAACILCINFLVWQEFEVFPDGGDQRDLLLFGQHGRRGDPVKGPVDLPDVKPFVVHSELHRRQRSAKSIIEEPLNQTANQIQLNVANHNGHRQKLEKVKPKFKNVGFVDSNFLSGSRSHRRTELDDIFISVKTTKKNHKSRLDLLLETWIVLARDQTYIFTDEQDYHIPSLPSGHVINTNCSSSHNRKALCCKMSLEYDHFMASSKRWFCHVDDDTYVSVPQLVQLLQRYNHTEDWYLGKPSLKHPIEVLDRRNPGQKIAFWFATGGAGFCISRALGLKMMPHASGGRLMTAGEQIRLPDDCTVGYIIDYLLKKELTVVDEFHSHLEALWQIKAKDVKNQITFSYSQYGEKLNVVNIPGFNETEDPTRFWSIHCHLYPYLKQCSRLSSR